MSANNYILVDRNKLEVSISLEEAIDIAQTIYEESLVEYGIIFEGKKGKKVKVNIFDE